MEENRRNPNKKMDEGVQSALARLIQLAKQDRPALIAMLSDLRKRKLDVVVVWSLNRLARSLKQLLSIAEEYKSVGMDLVSMECPTVATSALLKSVQRNSAEVATAKGFRLRM